jgi:hypothetical protein
MSKLGTIYERRGPALQRARRRLRAALADVVAGIEDRSLVRAGVQSVRRLGGGVRSHKRMQHLRHNDCETVRFCRGRTGPLWCVR